MMRVATSVFRAAVLAVVCSTSTMQSASAITVDVAKKCRELTVKAHPPAVAGSRTGTAQAEREYFRACVAQGGKVKNDPPNEEPTK